MRNIKIIAITFLTLLYSCNAVKKVLSDPAKTEIVGRQWAAKNPCANDSVISFQPGDTIVTMDYKEDTLYYYVNDTLRVPYGINKTQTINRFVHDSTKVAVRDTRAERILKDSVDQYLGKMKMYQGESATNKSKALKWKIFFWLLFGSILAYIFRKNILSLVKHLIPVTIP